MDFQCSTTASTYGDRLPTGIRTFKVKGKTNKGELLALCPICVGKTDKGRPTVYINLKKKVAHCKRCWKGFRLSTEEIRAINNNGSHNSMIRHCTAPSPSYDEARGFIRLFPIPENLLAQKTAEYARERGINIETEPVYYSPEYPYYLIYKGEGWWQGRCISKDSTMKNLFPEGIPASAMCFVKDSPTYDHVVLVEGIFDAYACRKKGRLCVALLGSVLKSSQLTILSRIARTRDLTCVVFLDSDAIGKSAKIAQELRRFTFFGAVRRVSWNGTSGDPDSITHQCREHLISQANLVL
jgi:hypothetical protein